MAPLDDFQATIANDPVAHLITSIHIHAWADGYEQAVKDCADESDNLEIAGLRQLTFNDVCQLALERLSEQRREFDRAQLLATAELAKIAPRPSLT